MGPTAEDMGLWTGEPAERAGWETAGLSEYETEQWLEWEGRLTVGPLRGGWLRDVLGGSEGPGARRAALRGLDGALLRLGADEVRTKSGGTARPRPTKAVFSNRLQEEYVRPAWVVAEALPAVLRLLGEGPAELRSPALDALQRFFDLSGGLGQVRQAVTLRWPTLQTALAGCLFEEPLSVGRAGFCLWLPTQLHGPLPAPQPFLRGVAHLLWRFRQQPELGEQCSGAGDPLKDTLYSAARRLLVSGWGGPPVAQQPQAAPPFRPVFTLADVVAEDGPGAELAVLVGESGADFALHQLLGSLPAEHGLLCRLLQLGLARHLLPAIAAELRHICPGIWGKGFQAPWDGAVALSAAGRLFPSALGAEAAGLRARLLRDAGLGALLPSLRRLRDNAAFLQAHGDAVSKLHDGYAAALAHPNVSSLLPSDIAAPY